jgi:hypothetical protein
VIWVTIVTAGGYILEMIISIYKADSMYFVSCSRRFSHLFMMLCNFLSPALGSLLILFSVSEATNVAASISEADESVRSESLFKKDAASTLQGSYIVEFESVANGNVSTFRPTNIFRVYLSNG